MRTIKNKKGFLLATETLKIIISVICIGFLIYFLSMIYFSKSGIQKKIDAEGNLERIQEIIDALKVGESEKQGIGNPSGWHIFSFVSGTKPNSCAGQSCLCICPNAIDINGKFDRQVKKCDSKGVCNGIRGLKTNGDLDITIMGGNSLVFLEISKTPNGIYIIQRI